MLRKMLAIGYEQNEFKKICQCFRTMDHRLELIRADSPSEAVSLLQSNKRKQCCHTHMAALWAGLAGFDFDRREREMAGRRNVVTDRDLTRDGKWKYNWTERKQQE